MKKLLFALLAVAFFSCDETKKTDTTAETPATVQPTVDTAIDILLPTEQDSVQYDAELKGMRGPRRKVKPIPQLPTPTEPQPTPTPTPVPTAGRPSVIYFDRDGETVRHPGWNGGATITAAPAAMDDVEWSIAMYRTQKAYEAYSVIITDDLAVYQAATTAKVRVIVTGSSEWARLGVSGLAHIGSFNQDNPAWVFADRLYSIGKYVGAIMVHEAGHTLGLQHQSEWSDACAFLNTYRMGWEMGNGLYSDAGAIFGRGQTYSCDTYQEDQTILKNVLGLKP